MMKENESVISIFIKGNERQPAMVDSISKKVGDNSLLNLINTDKTDSTQAANAVNATNTATTAAPDATTTDTASDATNVTISDQARQAAASDKDVIKFSRLAQRDKTPFDTDKVATFKAMLDNGRINSYLSGLNTDQLASAMLQSTKSFLLS